MFLCMQVLLCLDIHASKCFLSILTQLPDVISICHLPFTSPMPRISALRACTSARRQLSHSRASSRARLWKFWYWNWLLSTLTSLTSPPDTRLPFIDDGLWEAGNRNSFYNKIIKTQIPSNSLKFVTLSFVFLLICLIIIMQKSNAPPPLKMWLWSWDGYMIIISEKNIFAINKVEMLMKGFHCWDWSYYCLI